MKKYDNIQVLRITACLGVFITHLAPRMGVTGRAASVANFGAAGVYLFFMISGFLACRAKDIQPGSGWRSILIYYCKRMLRVLPLYYAVVLYNVLLHHLFLQDVPADPAGLYWFRYIFLTNAFIPAPGNFWANLCATWTVSLFCVFYICAPVLVRIAGGQGKKSNILRTAVLYMAALLLRYLWVGAGLSSYMMYFYYLHFFVLGMLVCQLAYHYRPLGGALRFSMFAAVIWGVIEIGGAENDYFTCISWVFALVILLTGEFSWKCDKTEASGRYCPTKPVTVGAKAAGEGWRAGAVRMLNLLDEHSYAIYLVHAVVIDGIGMLQTHVQLGGIAVLGIAVILTAVGAWLARLLIEKPAEKLTQSLVAALRK